ncbi:MAG TPA: nuclear transport factor 2 family protein [Chthoniobacterales bacterium]|nr:nuclear transport factor 2 family protein [Chthoniobacterales bacterium]
MSKTIILILLMAANAVAKEATQTDNEIWKLEKAYWEYVKANDLEKYRSLWHDDFVGWPSVSSAPARKDHITDWITANTSKGLKLQSYAIEELAVQVTGDVAINHYRVKANWGTLDKPDAQTTAVRITHTWIRTKDSWQILGGMSCPVNDEGH